MDAERDIGENPRRSAGIWRVVLISAVVNLGLLITYEAAQRGNLIGKYLPDSFFSSETAISAALPTEEMVIPAKGDLSAELPPPKGELQLTIAVQSSSTEVAEEKINSQEQTGAPATEMETAADQTLSSLTSTENQAIAPILLKDPQTGKLLIGQFKSMTMDGDSDECLGMANSMLEDIGAETDLLDVMAASDSITIARICTANGNLVFTCRNNSIVISPRRSRPDDNCNPA
jgi:hypothetical protein